MQEEKNAAESNVQPSGQSKEQTTKENVESKDNLHINLSDENVKETHL